MIDKVLELRRSGMKLVDIAAAVGFSRGYVARLCRDISLPEKECANPNCNRVFTPHREGNNHCSRGCRVEHQRQNAVRVLCGTHRKHSPAEE